MGLGKWWAIDTRRSGLVEGHRPLPLASHCSHSFCPCLSHREDACHVDPPAIPHLVLHFLFIFRGSPCSAPSWGFFTGLLNGSMYSSETGRNTCVHMRMVSWGRGTHVFLVFSKGSRSQGKWVVVSFPACSAGLLSGKLD